MAGNPVESITAMINTFAPFAVSLNKQKVLSLNLCLLFDFSLDSCRGCEVFSIRIRGTNWRNGKRNEKKISFIYYDFHFVYRVHPLCENFVLRVGVIKERNKRSHYIFGKFHHFCPEFIVNCKGSDQLLKLRLI